MIDAAAIRVRWEMFGAKLDERGRRLFAATEVRAAGRGGLALVSKITGLARSTINRGEDDLDEAPWRGGAFGVKRRPTHARRQPSRVARSAVATRRAVDARRSDASSAL